MQWKLKLMDRAGIFIIKADQPKGESAMKVLIVSSSPRKGGNSDVLCDQFAKGAEEAGYEVEKVNLREKKLFPCRACYTCMENHICAINDDMAKIFPKLVAAGRKGSGRDLRHRHLGQGGCLSAPVLYLGL